MYSLGLINITQANASIMESIEEPHTLFNSPKKARRQLQTPRWEDLFQLDDQLTNTEKMIQATARNYARDKLSSRVIGANRNEVFDRDILSEMGELGLLGSTIEEEFGGVIRHVMNLEAVNTYEGTHDIHALILGRCQTNIQAFS